MIIIGEKLNSSVPAMREALQNNDIDYIRRTAKMQAEYGADYIDVNAGEFIDEREKLLAAVCAAYEASDCGISLDTIKPEVARYVLERVKPKRLIINSASLDEERLAGMAELAVKYDGGLIALPIKNGRLPADAQQRVEYSRELISRLGALGLSHDRIYIDILAEAASASSEGPASSLAAAAAIRREFPDVHINAGISNVSYGMPKRKVLNSAFFCFAVANGVDSAIVDVIDPEMRLMIRAAVLINGEDEYCGEYIAAFRKIKAEE